MKLKNKFLMIFLTISTIPIIIITFFTYDRYTYLIQEQTTQVADTIFEKAVIEANNTLEEIKNIALVFNFYSENTESIVDNLRKYRENGPEYTYYDIMTSNQKLSFSCRNFIFSYEYIKGIFVFTPSGPVLGYGNNIDILPDYSPVDDPWYQDTLAQNGALRVSDISEKPFLLTPTPTPSISFSQAIYDVNTGDFLGVLLIECKPEIFDLSSVNTLPDIAMLAIEDEAGNILYSNVNTLKTQLTAKNARTQSAQLDLDHLRLIFSINYNDLYKEFDVTRIMILAISIICFLVFVVISVFLSHNVTKPIVYLSSEMADWSRNKPKLPEQFLKRTDEIGVLYNEYTNMLDTISTYIKKELQNKLITLDSQMKSLEAQINSHFLYNTLESINTIAELEDIDSISTMSQALGNMFRYSIKTKSELVDIQEEINHVMDYCAIQRIRFDNRFSLLLEIPKEMYSLKVLKLILQPLVENAFYHGLNYCRCGSYIKVRGWRDDRCIYLTVEDDGAGMTPEQVKKLEKRLNEPVEFTELGQRNSQSIGIKNIHTRIILYYGEGYGLTILSSEGAGTTMKIRLPILSFDSLQ